MEKEICILITVVLMAYWSAYLACLDKMFWISRNKRNNISIMSTTFCSDLYPIFEFF